MESLINTEGAFWLDHLPPCAIAPHDFSSSPGGNCNTVCLLLSLKGSIIVRELYGYQYKQKNTSDANDMLTRNYTALEKIVRDIYENTGGSHDWEHTRRVTELAKTIAMAEQADLAVVTAAALLHDIGRCGPDKKNKHVCHAQTGARLAKPILDDFNFSDKQNSNILHCIEAHRFRRPPAPQTLEARVVFDADKLDAIGAVGIARAYLFAGELGAVLHNPDIDVAREPSYSQNDTGYREFLVKLQYIKNKMLTNQGKQMAADRHDFMELYFNRFLKEYAGEM